MGAVYPLNHTAISSEKTIDRPKRVPLRLPAAKGSVTAEAAVVVPLFFFAVLALFYLLEVMAIRTGIRDGMQYAAKCVAEEMYLKPMVSTGKLESDLVEAVGSERLDRSIVVGGSSGIECRNSAVSMVTGILDLKVRYQVKLPLPVFAVPPVSMEESLRMKGWNGYAGSGFQNQEDDTVYVTENGMVYHKDYHCHYLDLSIRAVSRAAVSGLRNESEGKYYPCEYCAGSGSTAKVFITDYGDRYHNSITCSGLKRTIYAVPQSEAVGKGACSKCAR